MTRTLALFLLSLMLSITSVWAVEISGSIFTADEAISQTFPSPKALVQVEVFNGYIDVQASPENKIQADVIKRGAGMTQAAAQEDLKNIKLDMEMQGDRLLIRAKRIKDSEVPNSGAMVKLRVPAGTQLQLHTSNDVITLNGALGQVTAETSNADISTAGTQGRLNLQTSNGAVTIRGGLDAITVKTSNADVDIVAERVLVSAETSNGKLSFSGSPAKGVHSFTTSCGDMSLTLPPTAMFKLNAETSNGSVTSEFPLTTTQVAEENCLKGTVGRDTAMTLNLQTSNADIQLRKK